MKTRMKSKPLAMLMLVLAFANNVHASLIYDGYVSTQAGTHSQTRGELIKRKQDIAGLANGSLKSQYLSTSSYIGYQLSEEGIKIDYTQDVEAKEAFVSSFVYEIDITLESDYLYQMTFDSTYSVEYGNFFSFGFLKNTTTGEELFRYYMDDSYNTGPSYLDETTSVFTSGSSLSGLLSKEHEYVYVGYSAVTDNGLMEFPSGTLSNFGSTHLMLEEIQQPTIDIPEPHAVMLLALLMLGYRRVLDVKAVELV